MTDSNNAQNSTAGVSIEFKNITKQYRGQQSPAVDNLSLKIPAGELVAFVGPSGCGKTTSLKMINRLVEPTSGQILINVKTQSSAILRNCAVRSAMSSKAVVFSPTFRSQTTLRLCHRC